MHGRRLVPLSTIKKEWPNLYQKLSAKYIGREFVMECEVFPLSCLWNDVIHFSPVHPLVLDKALRKVGFQYPPLKWFEIDPERLNFSRENACIFLHTFREDVDPKKNRDDFIPYTTEEAKKLGTVPAETIRYFEECLRADADPLLFQWVPHILYKGEIEVDGIKIIEG
jgi:hypothetical protein